MRQPAFEHKPGPGSNPAGGTLAIPFTPLSQGFSEEIHKPVGPFYLVSMPWEVKYPTSLQLEYVTCRGLHIPNHSCASPKMGCLKYTGTKY